MNKLKSNVLMPLAFTVVIVVVLFLLSLLANGSDAFVFWGDNANTIFADTANNAIRETSNFNWSFIFFFTVVVFIYFTELKN